MKLPRTTQPACCKWTNDLRPPDPFRGMEHLIEKPLCLLMPLSLATSQKSGNASHGDAQLWWSPPGIAREPVVPTPATMRTDGPRRGRGRRKALGGLSQSNHLDVLSAHWRRQHVEVLPLAEIPQGVSPPPRPPRAIRSHRRWSWHDRLARNAWWGPPRLRVTVAGVPAFLAIN